MRDVENVSVPIDGPHGVAIGGATIVHMHWTQSSVFSPLRENGNAPFLKSIFFTRCRNASKLCSFYLKTSCVSGA